MKTTSIPFDAKLLPVKMLRTGHLTCMYEHGNLRYIKCGETEVIRMIYVAVRNEYWDTAPYSINDEKVEEKENGFFVSYRSIHLLNDILYKTDVSITAENNSISFFVHGEALSTFKRNRIGLCVLHPVGEYVGKEVKIKTPYGADYTAIFPNLISPHQPFKDIQVIRCTVEGIETKLVFNGDVFETEDQRNWADSSFKTYSTPLQLPYPVQVNKGDTIEQKVKLIVSHEKEINKRDTNQFQETKIPFPKIGYGRVCNEKLTKDEIHLLQKIPFDHYRVELFLCNNGWKKELETAAWEATQLGTKLELSLFFTDDFSNELADIRAAIDQYHLLIESILVLQEQQQVTPIRLLEFVYSLLKKKYPQLQIGFGSNSFFSELNRNRPVGVPFDFLSFSLTPQVHASDTRTLIENLERQNDLIETARSFAAGKDIYISPITFKIPVSVDRGSNQPHPDYDVRQHTSFGAFWTLTTIKNLSSADHLTFYQAKGYRGILGEGASNKNESALYRLLTDIKAFCPKWLIANNASFPPFLGNVVLENEQGERAEFVFESPD